MKRTPMKRTAFKRKHQPTVPRAERQMARLTPLVTPPNYAGSTTGQPIEKERPLRSLAYRRLVAAMPCADCRFPGRSQAAHANYGKGMALKTDDRTCFPLCDRCHRMHDQGGQMPRETRRDFELRWGAETRAAILAAGQWPKNLPLWENA